IKPYESSNMQFAIKTGGSLSNFGSTNCACKEDEQKVHRMKNLIFPDKKYLFFIGLFYEN
ncbi:MAG: hypothetical protein V3V72_01975, partial [Ignavibacteriaceae bacterium]